MIDDENLIEPGDFKDWPHLIVHSAQSELAPVFLDALKGTNQDRDAGTVDEGHSGKIDHEVIRLSFDH